jgi:hypothetical protein
MTFDQIPYNIAAGLLHFLVAFGIVSAIALFVGFVVSLLTFGMRGPAIAVGVLGRGIVDVTRISPRRIGAVMSLTIKESYRKKAFAVLIVFLMLFMFAGFFLNSPTRDLDAAAKPFIAFILTTIQWMCLPVALLLSCWGLPTDIKDRSLHTVVTKPVRRSEVVIGRVLGYCAVVTSFLVVMSVLGYVFILREVPQRAKSQLVSRVPVYGTVKFLTREGETREKDYATGKVADKEFRGYNVGDIWGYRGYIEGVTRCSATWTFENLDKASLRNLPSLTFENSFEAFRSHKGTINAPVRFRMTLVNPAKNLRVSNGEMVRGVAEFSQEIVRGTATAGEGEFVEGTRVRPTSVVTIPKTIKYVDVTAGGAEGQEKTVDLFDDVFEDNKLTVEITCPDSGQYVGAAQSDLFIRLPDRGFESTYFKSIFNMWLMLMLVCLLGTTASCFVKGPVATILIFSLVLLGETMRPFMDKMLGEHSSREGGVLGGGMLESFYRVVTQMNQQSELPDTFSTRTMKLFDAGILEVMGALKNIIPNFTYFDSSPWTINGFDVSWSSSMLPAIATALAYIIPCILLGYFSLQLRELEAK